MNAPVTPNLPALFPMSDLERMAEQMVKSKLFGVQDISQAVTLMLVAQAEGQHPACAARDYHIIQGRPAMKADTMLARFQKAGGIVEWEVYTDTRVMATFRHPQSPKPVPVEWTIERAQQVGLASKDNWKKYPRAMLRARVISEGVRTCYPVVSPGIYAPEEIEHFTEIDVTPGMPSAPITPTTGSLAALPIARQEIIIQTAQQVKTAFSENRLNDAYGLYTGSGFDNDEKIAFWSLLPDSKLRGVLKRMHEAEEAADKGVISTPQKKRLEALIKEYKLDRDNLKGWIKDAYKKEHFTDLTPEEYEDLEAHMRAMKKEGTA